MRKNIWGRYRDEAYIYDHLEHHSFAELYALKRESEERLQALRRREAAASRKGAAAYFLWVGRNVECISNLQKVVDEISRRKERAMTPFRFDGTALLL